VTLWCIGLLAAQGKVEPVLQDPAFMELSKLVGGDWEGSVGEGAAVHNHFEFAVDGKMVKGNGTVTAGGHVVLRTQPNMGWDPVAKKVSYVDFHNHDTVYAGHVSMQDGWMVYDFTELAQPRNHFTARSRLIDADHYEFLLGNEVIKMTRKR